MLSIHHLFLYTLVKLLIKLIRHFPKNLAPEAEKLVHFHRNLLNLLSICLIIFVLDKHVGLIDMNTKQQYSTYWMFGFVEVYHQMTKHLLSMNWFSPKFIDYRAAILSPIASNNLLNWIWFVIHLWFQQYLIHENCGYLSFLMNFFFQWQIIIFFNYELCFSQPHFF